MGDEDGIEPRFGAVAKRIGDKSVDACLKPHAHSIGIASQELDDLVVRFGTQQDIAELSGAKTQAGRKAKACGKKLCKRIDVESYSFLRITIVVVVESPQ